jgi:protein involved in polysaccharide export with SLBB domain
MSFAAQENMCMSRQVIVGVCVAASASIALQLVIGMEVAGPQERGHGAPPGEMPDGRGKRAAEIGKMLEAYDLKPRPLAPIPDDPPPHEGAMIGIPFVIEAPDLVLIEVLEATPGRPISGERLVRPDGTISLGFYGDVNAKGLSLDQLKVAIIKHLRPYISDENLGLAVRLADDPIEAPEPGTVKPPMPALPTEGKSPLEIDGEPKKRSTSLDRGVQTRQAARRAAPRGASRRVIPVQQAAARGLRRPSQAEGAPVQQPHQITVPAGDARGITITIQVDGPNGIGAAPGVNAAPEAPPLAAEAWTTVPPAESATVFVDVTAYNSKQYYVEGDLTVVGRFPWTGNETVLDAIHFAGGFLPSADPKDIRLVRPPRGGKPAKILKVDYEAIQDKGDVTSNYQIFPGDRLIVGRNEVVKKTTEIDRLNAPILSITGSILQGAMALRALQFATTGNRDKLLEEYVDFWSKAIFKNGDLKFDEQTLRDAFIRKMKLPPAPAPGGP